VRTDEKLTAFLELESTIRAAELPENCRVRENKARQVVAASDKNALDYVIRRFNLSSARLNKPQELDLR
jgi:hypothetical protein